MNGHTRLVSACHFRAISRPHPRDLVTRYPFYKNKTKCLIVKYSQRQLKRIYIIGNIDTQCPVRNHMEIGFPLQRIWAELGLFSSTHQETQ